MTSKQMAKKIGNMFPAAFILENAIFSSRYEHVFSGFYIEKTRACINVYSLMFPAYDPLGVVHLLYSKKVGYIPLYVKECSFKNEDEAVRNITDIVNNEKYLLDKTITLEDFLLYMKNSPGLLENGYGMFIYGLTNCLLGNADICRDYLFKALPLLNKNHEGLCDNAIEALNISPKDLNDLLSLNELTFKTKYKIPTALI